MLHPTANNHPCFRRRRSNTQQMSEARHPSPATYSTVTPSSTPTRSSSAINQTPVMAKYRLYLFHPPPKVPPPYRSLDPPESPVTSTFAGTTHHPRSPFDDSQGVSHHHRPSLFHIQHQSVTRFPHLRCPMTGLAPFHATPSTRTMLDKTALCGQLITGEN
ncbi:hypothetical protein L1887_32180 [Cichorium endivia]|nr:hypothetical protein L1887_32180 [Cichorium endivia]